MLQSADGHAVLAGAPPAPSYLTDGTTVMSWLNTRDHKRVGIMFLVMVILGFLIGGIFALTLRMKLLEPGPFLFDALTYNRLFTLHGVAMIFFFMIPAIPSAFGNFVLPLMLGARDVAFPRLNLASFYVYLGGVTLTLWGMVHGGVDTGWTFYTPYSTTTTTQAFWVVLGLFIIGFSSIMTGLNFIVTVHTLRAPGLTWMRMPLFVWATYGTSIIQVLATPVMPPNTRK
ncbi:MAG: cbb3-type cytochrome c oxidase subunit I [Deltaproteobacteria bacterium]|nr:cbb3-type cytochrome c oxidase subunit I [Deltaproteobacteria bacterium]